MNLKFFRLVEKFISYTIELGGQSATTFFWNATTLGGILFNVVQASRLFLTLS
jgi:hypothetical protein